MESDVILLASLANDITYTSIKSDVTTDSHQFHLRILAGYKAKTEKISNLQTFWSNKLTS